MADLAHAIHGPRDGPAVVLLHGFPYDRAMWRFQVGPLTGNGYRVVLPDLPGFGHTDPDPATGIDRMADDVVRLLDRAKIPKAVVVGFSMGGYVALSIAARHSARLAGLVLIDTKAPGDTPEGQQKRDATIADVEAHGVRILVAPSIAKQFTEATRKQHLLLVDEVRAMMLRQAKAGVVGALRAMRDRSDRVADLARVQAPTLVLVGDQDPVTPPADAKALADGIVGARLVTIAGAAHLSPMEQPQQVTDALLDWLEAMAPVQA